MPLASRISVANLLDPLGLRSTLIAIRKHGVYTVSRIRRITPQVDLVTLGEFSSEQVPCIGRVGIADPAVDFPWKNSMAFYGKWFDQRRESTLKQQVYRNCPRISHDKMLDQIRRDDEYAVVGSYYSVFRTIIEAKRRVPLVLIDDAVLSLASFPVLLPTIGDADFEQLLLGVLNRMLRLYPAVVRPLEDGPPGVDGIEVEET
jgi:hypothetical protein